MAAALYVRAGDVVITAFHLRDETRIASLEIERARHIAERLATYSVQRSAAATRSAYVHGAGSVRASRIRLDADVDQVQRTAQLRHDLVIGGLAASRCIVVVRRRLRKLTKCGRFMGPNEV